MAYQLSVHFHDEKHVTFEFETLQEANDKLSEILRTGETIRAEKVITHYPGHSIIKAKIQELDRPLMK
jgi:hypothetical protein